MNQRSVPHVVLRVKEKQLKHEVSLLGGRRLLEVPQFEGVILRGGDQNRLQRVEGQAPHRVKVAPQGELRVPRFPQNIFVVGDLREGKDLIKSLESHQGGSSTCLLPSVQEPSENVHMEYINHSFSHVCCFSRSF